MPFLVYVAIVLVSTAGILFELDWLTKPKSDVRSPVQVATRAAAPSPRANAKVKDPNADLAAVTNKNPDIPRPVAKNPDAPQVDQVDEAVVHGAAATAAATPLLTANALIADATQMEQQPAALPVQQADGSTAGRALADTRALPYGAPPTPAATAPPVRAAAAVAPTHTAAVTPNRCAVQACSSAYQSFRASDCTYQPFEGPRRICESPPATGRVTASQTRAEPHRQATYGMGNGDDRDVVVRRARPVDADDDDVDEEDDRGAAGSQVIVIERPARRW